MSNPRRIWHKGLGRPAGDLPAILSAANFSLEPAMVRGEPTGHYALVGAAGEALGIFPQGQTPSPPKRFLRDFPSPDIVGLLNGFLWVSWVTPSHLLYPWEIRTVATSYPNRKVAWLMNRSLQCGIPVPAGYPAGRLLEDRQVSQAESDRALSWVRGESVRDSIRDSLRSWSRLDLLLAICSREWWPARSHGASKDFESLHSGQRWRTMSKAVRELL